MFSTKFHFFFCILLSSMLLQGSEKSRADGKKNVLTATAQLKQTGQYFQQLAAQRTENLIATEVSEIATDVTTLGISIDELFTQQEFKNIYKAMVAINNLIPYKSTISQIIQQTHANNPLFQQKVNDYAEQYVLDKCEWKEGCHKLYQPLKNHIESQAMHNTCSLVDIPFPADWQKISLTFISPDTIALFHLFSYDWIHRGMIGSDRPKTKKQLQLLDIIRKTIKQMPPACYNVHQEITDTEKYLNQPSYGEYNKQKDNYYKTLLPNWHAESQQRTRMSSFPNGTIMVTYPWGGVEVYTNDEKKNFIVDNSIASVCCFPDNKHIALGSYDGHITIIDITQENTQKDYKTKHFDLYFTEYLKTGTPDTSKHPLTITTQRVSTDPITHIIYNSDALLFATENNVYRIYLPNPSEKKDFIYEEFDTKHYTITALDSFNGWPIFGTNSGHVTLWLEDAASHLQRIDQNLTADDPISCLCHYTNDSDQTFLVTGTLGGCLDIWAVPQRYKPNNSNEFINKAHIKHDHPIYSVEVSPDKKSILVKTTEHKAKTEEESCNEKYIDHAYIYNTLETLLEFYQQRSAKIENIYTLYNKHVNNEQMLYKILVNNIAFLHSANSSKVTQLKTNLFAAITTLVQQKKVSSLEELKNFLLAFESIRIGESMMVGMSVQKLYKTENPLEEVIDSIKNQQFTSCAQVIKKCYENGEYSKQELDQFASLFRITIKWDKLLNTETTDITEAIAPTRMYLQHISN